MSISLTRNERWGRLWLALFSVVSFAWCAFGLALSLAKLIQTGHINVTNNVLLPFLEIYLLVQLWTGEPWARWCAVAFYGIRGGKSAWVVAVLILAMQAATPPEQAAAGRKILLILMPGFAVLLLFAAMDWGMCLLLALSPSVRAFSNHQRYANQHLGTALRDWCRPRDTEPKVREQQIGDVATGSGTLLIADPMYITDPRRIVGVPAGRFPVVAQIIQYPEGGQRIVRIQIRFRAGVVEKREPLGRVGVDSAMVIAVDERTYEDHWKEVGPERIGMTHSPNDNRKVAALIEKKFGLKWRPLDGFRSMFLEPIPEDLEQGIETYLKTFPEYADYPFMYFRVETHNTFDRITDAMSEESWAKLPLTEDGDESLMVFSSGFGDGRYDLVGVYGENELLAIEITFIGPEQDKILEGFPFLRETI